MVKQGTTKALCITHSFDCMGGCLTKSFTVNKDRQAALKCFTPFLFSMADAESVLQESEAGDYLMYRDYNSDRIILSVRYPSYIYHRRITELNNLYYLDGQPYPYLDSIILYNRKHKLNGMKLNKQAHLSARAVRLFAHKVTNTNGNHVTTQANGGVLYANGSSQPDPRNSGFGAVNGDALHSRNHNGQYSRRISQEQNGNMTDSNEPNILKSERL